MGAFGTLTKYKRRKRRRRGGARPALTVPQRVFNNVHEHVRNRCENVISKVKNHAFLRNVWTGSFETLASMVKVTGHRWLATQREAVPWIGSHVRDSPDRMQNTLY